MLSAMLMTALLFREPTAGYIYLGDSRFVGMDNVCHVSEEDNTWVVAKVGEGLRWCENTALDEVSTIINDNPDIDEWYLISGLGVNDSYNAAKYVEMYDSLDDVYVVLVSVNPMEKSKCDKYGYDYSALTRGANAMNEILRDTEYTYIDVSTHLEEVGFSTADGVHYTGDTYEEIYEYIKEQLNVLNEV